MLSELQHLKDNPETVPQLTRLQRTQLQARFNAGWLLGNGTLEFLKKKGFSEQFAFGYIAGLQAAADLLDDYEAVTLMNQEEANDVLEP